MSSLAELLSKYPNLSLLPSNKIRCSLTQHEMPARFDAVNQYITGSQFRKATEWYSFDFSKYAPDIVTHKDDSKFLFCTVTKTKLNKIPKEVEKHLQGRRFKRLLDEHRLQQSKVKSKSSKNTEDSEESNIWFPPDIIEPVDEGSLPHWKRKRGQVSEYGSEENSDNVSGSGTSIEDAEHDLVSDDDELPAIFRDDSEEDEKLDSTTSTTIAAAVTLASKKQKKNQGKKK